MSKYIFFFKKNVGEAYWTSVYLCLKYQYFLLILGIANLENKINQDLIHSKIYLID